MSYDASSLTVLMLSVIDYREEIECTAFTQDSIISYKNKLYVERNENVSSQENSQSEQFYDWFFTSPGQITTLASIN